MEVPRGLVQGGLCHLRHIVQEAVRGAVPQGRRRPCWGFKMLNLKNSTQWIEPQKKGRNMEAQRKKWRDKEAKKQSKKTKGGGGEKGTPGRGHLISLSGAATFPPPPASQHKRHRQTPQLGGGCSSGNGLSVPSSRGSRTPTTSAQAYYLPAPRSSSSVLFQRVCLAWD